VITNVSYFFHNQQGGNMIFNKKRTDEHVSKPENSYHLLMKTKKNIDHLRSFFDNHLYEESDIMFSNNFNSLSHQFILEVIEPNFCDYASKLLNVIEIQTFGDLKAIFHSRDDVLYTYLRWLNEQGFLHIWNDTLAYIASDVWDLGTLLSKDISIHFFDLSKMGPVLESAILNPVIMKEDFYITDLSLDERVTLKLERIRNFLQGYSEYEFEFSVLDDEDIRKEFWNDYVYKTLDGDFKNKYKDISPPEKWTPEVVKEYGKMMANVALEWIDKRGLIHVFNSELYFIDIYPSDLGEVLNEALPIRRFEISGLSKMLQNSISDANEGISDNADV